MWLGQGGHQGVVGSGDLETDVDLEKPVESSRVEAQGVGSRERYCGVVGRTPVLISSGPAGRQHLPRVSHPGGAVPSPSLSPVDSGVSGNCSQTGNSCVLGPCSDPPPASLPTAGLLLLQGGCSGLASPALAALGEPCSQGRGSP